MLGSAARAASSEARLVDDEPLWRGLCSVHATWCSCIRNVVPVLLLLPVPVPVPAGLPVSYVRAGSMGGSQMLITGE